MASQNFAFSELAQALSEESYGIRSYTMMKNDVELVATAEVQLLEGTAVEISLTSRGYQLKGRSEEYESIEQVLQVASGLYEEARHMKLLALLAGVADPE